MLVMPRHKVSAQGNRPIRGIRDFPDGCHRYHRQTRMLQVDDLNGTPPTIRGIRDSPDGRCHLGFLKTGDLVGMKTLGLAVC